MRLYDDFSDIPNGTAAGSADNWDFTSDSPTSTATFQTSTLQTIGLFSGNGEKFLEHVTDPTQAHQCVEAVMKLSSTPPGTCFSGVFAKYQDKDNYVIVRFNHNTRQAQLVEVDGGSATVLATSTLTAASTTVGVGVRLEIIGIRARMSFNVCYGTVADAPPDAAADLAGTYDSVGKWGIYLNTSSTNTLQVTRFYARDLPEDCAPPPSLYAEAADGRNYTPITAAAGSVSSDAQYLEWEVSPLDPDDFPEGYRDISVASLTSRVFYVRPGYQYEIRVRALLRAGGYSDWVSSTITASGSKVSPSTPTMPDDVFPDVTPDYALARSSSPVVVSHRSESDRVRVLTRSPRPRNGWTVRFENRTRDEILPIENFFNRMQARNTPWVFTHPTTGEQFAVRFDQDRLSPMPTDDQFDGLSPLYTLTFEIVEKQIGAVATIDPTIELDGDLRP